jgi:cyclohexyl-isocyanide hydratase
MDSQVGILIYSGVSELELGLLLGILKLAGDSAPPTTLARSRASIQGQAGMVITPHAPLTSTTKLRALLIPGGSGAAKAARDLLIRDYLRREPAELLGVSGSGALLAGEAGLLTGQRVAASPSLEPQLWIHGPSEVVVAGLCRNPRLLSASAGLGAGELALALVADLYGEERAGSIRERLGPGPADALSGAGPTAPPAG